MEKIITKVDPPIGWIIFNRPEVMNAFDVEMWESLPRIALELDERRDVKVIIMKGEGNVFGAGADIKELLDYAQKGISQKYADAVHRCFSGLSQIKKITIAAIERYALGGGCMVALSCDLRVAGNSAKIGVPLVKLGLAVEPLGIKRLIEIAGASFALEFLLMGDPIPKEKLQASGIVNYFVEDDKVIEFCENLAHMLLKNGFNALLTTKAIVNEFRKQNPNWNFLNQTFASCMDTEEFKSRAQRFICK